MTLHLIFAAVFFVGALGSRPALVGARGGVQQRNVAYSFIGAVAVFVTLSLIIWGFVSLPWYWPVCTFVVSSILAALLVTRSNWSTWFSIAPLLNLIAAGGGLYLWVQHWPF